MPDESDVVLRTPVPQRLFGRLRLVLVPVLQNSLGIEQILESRVGALAPEEIDDSVAPLGKLTGRKAKGETLSEIEIDLVGQQEIAVRDLEIGGNLIIERAQLRGVVDLPCLETDIRTVLTRGGRADKVEGTRLRWRGVKAGVGHPGLGGIGLDGRNDPPHFRCARGKCCGAANTGSKSVLTHTSSVPAHLVISID